MPSLLQIINAHMHEGHCPQQGCLGECAAIFKNESFGPNIYEAHLHLWDTQFQDSGRVAEWFRAEGASDIWVEHVLHSDVNETRNGVDHDGSGPSRHWVVTFTLPPEASQPREQRAIPLAIVDSQPA